MTEKQMEILTNIIGGVESGGQIYGKRRYDAYAGKGANSANEKTCTLGWAQNYGNEGRKLCKMILAADPVAFRQADTAGIEAKLNVDWVATAWNPSAREKAALIAIITTDAGKRCQDELFAELMEKYIASALAYDPGMSVAAQMMWCEIEHLGGLGPVKRIFGRASKPYTVDGIYNSLLLDQNDTSNSNQVGDRIYQSRHQCCVKWIKQYLTDDTETEEGSTVGVTAQDVLSVMRSWLGYSESNGKYKQIIDLYNSHKPLARGYKVQYGDAWCDTCVSAAAIKAGAVDLIGTECGCEEHIKIFQQKGIWIEDGTITPEVGDIIVYNWDASKQPNDGYSDHIGYVENVSNRQITAIEGNKNDSVSRRTIAVGDPSIRGYARPKYATTSSAGGNTGSNSGSGTSGTSDTSDTSGAPSKTPKWVGEITKDGTAVRTWAGAETSIKSWPKLNATNLIDVCDTVKDNGGHDWYYVRIAGKYYGFVDSNFVKKAGASGGSTDDDTTKTYKVGKTYTLQVDALRVRTGAGTGYAAKSYSQLTSNARANAYSDGTLKRGTRVTCQAVKAVGEDVWIKIPSGWIAAYYSGKKYVA